MKLHVTRALYLRGKAHPAGAIVEAEPLEAAALLESGRAALVDDTDFAAVKTAVSAENAKVLARERRGHPNPWQ